MSSTLPLAEYRRLLGVYLRPQRGRVALLAALMIAGAGLQLLNPQIIRYFIDATQRPGAGAPLVYAGLAFIAAGLAGRGLTVATAYLSMEVGWRATNALRAALTEHLLRLDLPFHKRHTPGELIERVDGDVSELADFFARFVIRVATSGLLIAGALVVLLIENWPAGLALGLYSAISIAVLGALQGVGVRRWTAARQAAAAQFGYIEERLSAVEDIQGAGAAPYALSRLFAFTRRTLRARRAAEMVDYVSGGISGLLYGLGWALGLGVGAYLYTQGRITIGTVFLIVAYISMLAEPLDSLRRQASALQRATAGIGRIAALLRLEPVVRGGGQALPPGALAVQFAGVSFGYAGAEAPDGAGAAEDDGGLALRDVSFRLAAGRTLGVLGRTGSGKSTLARLLFRLYDPAAGAVTLGGVDIRAVGLSDLRGRVGLVTQDVQLFSASLRDNIAFFDPAVSDTRILAALDALGLRDWLAAMPQGLDTRLAAGGAGLSAGEAQLLAFTRLLLKDPGLIILDEAASRLDPITEGRLERAISRLLGADGAPRSAIIIAHRLRTVGRADDILILDAGRVVEYGPRAALAADPGSRFHRLLRTGLEEALA